MMKKIELVLILALVGVFEYLVYAQISSPYPPSNIAQWITVNVSEPERIQTSSPNCSATYYETKNLMISFLKPDNSVVTRSGSQLLEWLKIAK